MAALSEEQQMIKDQASAWVREQAPVSTFRAMRDQGLAQGFFSETWQAMIEMGWTGLVVPETYGGAGFLPNQSEALLPPANTINRGWLPYEIENSPEGKELARLQGSPLDSINVNENSFKEVKLYES